MKMAKARIIFCKLDDTSWRWELRLYGDIKVCSIPYSQKWQAIRNAKRVKELMAKAEIKED